MEGNSLRTANLLGAAVINGADHLLSAVAEAAGVSGSGAAALVTLHAFPGLGVTELGQRVGLSQPAATRMVDTLAGQGLVERRRESARSVNLRLTRRGQAAAARALRHRGRVVRQLLEGLSPAQQDALRDALEALLPRLLDPSGSEHVVCRLCDRAACLADGALCPVGHAARTRAGGRS